MLRVTCKPFMLNFIMLNVVKLSAVAPSTNKHSSLFVWIVIDEEKSEMTWTPDQ